MSDALHEQTLRADRAEDALREYQARLARVLQMADAWEAEWGHGGIKASVAAAALRRAARGFHAP